MSDNNEPTMINKVIEAGNDTRASTGLIGGAIATLLWYILSTVWTIPPPPTEVTIASTTIFTALIQYLSKY